MKEGDSITFTINGETKHGKILKIYTKVGFENHGEEFLIVSIYDPHLRFYEGDIEIINQNVEVI